MIKKTLQVINELGLHARPSSLLVKKASTFKSEITLEKDGCVSNAKSIMSVMMLAAAYNSILEMIVKGPDEKEAAKAIEDLFKKGFDECYH